MNKREIIERLKNIARHAVHNVGEKPFVMSIDDGIAVYEAIELLKNPETNCSEIPNNSDTISRQQAIESVKNYCENGCDIVEDNWCPSCQREQFVKLLKDLPSAQPEPRTAYWTKDIVGSVVCSNCGGIREDNRIGHTQWCNCCGCFMRGEEND